MNRLQKSVCAVGEWAGDQPVLKTSILLRIMIGRSSKQEVLYFI